MIDSKKNRKFDLGVKGLKQFDHYNLIEHT